MSSDFEAEKNKALVESTAQSIFNTLRELEGGRSIYGKRWPWELLQNAVDVAEPGGVDCTFILTEGELAFTHNGASFKMKEVAHLIYHGTTKTDEPDKIRFGTGFITTHLLSRKTLVKGLIEGRQGFEFELNREGTSWQELEDNMKEIEEEFIDSLSREVVLPGGITVEYKYPLSQQGKPTAIAGIEAVKMNIASVLALNKELSSVTVIENGVKTVWSKLSDEVKTVDERITIVPIQSISEGKKAVHSVVVATDGSVETALSLLGNYPESAVESMETLPKLFYGFPLATTEDFPIPAIINSPAFVPREKRDGILLGPDYQKDNLHNKLLVEKGIKLYRELVDFAVSLRCRGLHRLAKVNVLPDKTWLDSEWVKAKIAELIAFLKDSNLVERGIASDNKPILAAPKATYIPYNTDSETSLKIWSLAHSMYPNNLPSQNLVKDWAAILGLWSSYMDIDAAEMNEAFTLSKLALVVSQLGSLESLGNTLKGNPKPSSIQWLNDLLELVHPKQPQLLTHLELVPNQKGQLRKLTEIYKDEDIDDVLKDAISLLGREIREELCDKGITQVVQDLLTSYREETLLLEIVKRLKDNATSESEYSKKQYQEANVAVFAWLASKGRFDMLGDNFPVITRRKDKGESNYISYLLQEHPLLKPETLWDEDAKSHANLFPQAKILSNIYSNEKMDGVSWENLVNHGLILGKLFVKKAEALDDLRMRKLLAEGELKEQEDHGTNTEIELTSIAFLEAADWGIIDTVRRSKKKATEFLKFLLEYAVHKDTSWINPIPAECSCVQAGATHMIYPSKWLFVLKSREWVPISKNKEEQPTTENLAHLFQKDQILLKHLMEDRPSSFLSILGVSPSQILMASQPALEKLELDKAFVKLLLATSSNVNELNKIVQVYQDPNFRVKLEEAYSLQEKVKRNQSVGRHVEQVLRALLRKSLPEDKFKVYRITRAADIGIDVDLEFDLVDQDFQPVALGMSVQDNSFVIEVKSTHLDYVRITMPQANEAVQKLDSFMLCVVELPQGYEQLTDAESENLVRERARFVHRIGSKLEDKFNEAREFQNKQEEIKSAPLDDVVIDTSDVQIRLRLGKKLWTEEDLPVMTFDQLVEGLLKSFKSAGV